MRPNRRVLLAAAPALALAACGQRSVRAQPAPHGPAIPLKDAAPCPVGTCVMTPSLADPEFVALAARHFSQVTPEWEMKMERILADDGTYRFDAADQIAGFCRIHGMRLHATTFVWYAEDPPAFRPLVGDRPRFEAALRAYAATVMGRYKGLARGWDALNEAVAEEGDGYRGGVWAEGLGDDYARLSFEIAHEADPDAVLFLNDYFLETKPAKLDAFQRLAERLLKAGAPLGGLGTQSHLTADVPPGKAKRAIEALARFGLPIHVSELDISTRQTLPIISTADRLQAQARVAGEVAEAFMALPASQRYAFTVWGVRDKDSWLRRPPNAGDGTDQPLLFTDAGQPKPDFYAVETAFRRAPA